MSDTGKPEYGEYHEPAYGANASQYGPDYNPYIYGAPDPEPESAAAQSEAAARQGQPYGQPQQANGQQPYGGQSQYGPYNPYAQQGRQQNPQQNNQPYGGQPSPWGPNAGRTNGQGGPGTSGGSAHTPRYLNGIDLNDPNQNPMYGHWDFYAVVSLFLSLFFPVPVLSGLMGLLAMWRCRTFHMKGYWLGFAALVINVIQTIAVVWMLVNGIDAASLYQQMLDGLQGGGSSDSDVTINA